jgi:ribulose-5-phosphate 4-epimerase/fuculose-1-phosphate aldolase
LTAGAPKPTRDELVEKLVQSCRILYREVRSVQNPDPIGHFSARIPGTEEILIKPRDVGWNRVTADDIVTFDLKYRRLSGPEYEIIELPIHVEMYKSREDVMAVVHTHQTYATLMGTLGLKLELLDHNTLAFADGVPVYDESIDPTYFSPKFRTLIREERQGQILARKIGGANAIILKAHGPVIVGKSVEEAVRCYTLEGAYATREEGIKGSIEPGKLADVTILPMDITKPGFHLAKTDAGSVEKAKREMKKTKACTTILNGDIVYQA